MTATAAGSRDRPIRLSQRGQEAIWGYICILPWLLGMVLFIVGPMIHSIYLSFFRADYLTASEFIGAQNYKHLFFENEVWPKALRNTAVYTFSSVPLGIVGALLIAILLNQDVKALALFRTIYYLPAVVQGVAVAILWVWLFNPYYGPINGALKLLGVQNRPEWIWSEQWAMPALIIMSLWGVGRSMIIFLAGLQGVPQSLYEAANIDGAGVVNRFWHITIPMMTPTIFFTLVMGIINSWQMFSQAYIMTQGGPNNATLTVVLMLYRKAFQEWYLGYASAMAWVLFAIIMVFTLLIVRSSSAWVYYAGERTR